jgi:hypothetical protein
MENMPALLVPRITNFVTYLIIIDANGALPCRVYMGSGHWSNALTDTRDNRTRPQDIPNTIMTLGVCSYFFVNSGIFRLFVVVETGAFFHYS